MVAMSSPCAGAGPQRRGGKSLANVWSLRDPLPSVSKGMAVDPEKDARNRHQGE